MVEKQAYLDLPDQNRPVICGKNKMKMLQISSDRQFCREWTDPVPATYVVWALWSCCYTCPSAVHVCAQAHTLILKHPFTHTHRFAKYHCHREFSTHLEICTHAVCSKVPSNCLVWREVISLWFSAHLPPAPLPSQSVSIRPPASQPTPLTPARPKVWHWDTTTKLNWSESHSAQ